MPVTESSGRQPTSAASTSAGKNVRWLLRLLLCGALLLVVGIAVLPTLVTRTSLGHKVLRSQLARHGINLQIGAASFGWFLPAQLKNLQLNDDLNRWSLSAEQASSELTLWQLLWSGGDFGEFRLDEPTVVVHAEHKWPHEERSLPPEVKPAHRRLRLVVTQATVLVQTSEAGEPTPFVQQANVAVDYEQTGRDRFVTVAPGSPLKRAQITPGMCDLALKYVLPVLADVAWTRGAISLDLETCRIPLHDPRNAEVAGRLTLHSIESGMRESVSHQIVQLLARMSVNSTLPESLRLVDESVVSFRVRDGAVEHRDLAFGLPEISPDLVIRTEGTVGMEGSLDMLVTLPKTGTLLGDGSLARILQERTLRVPVRGTLQSPQLVLAGQDGLLGDVISDVGLPLLQDPSTAAQLLRELQQLRDRRREAEAPDRPGWLQRLRDRRLQDTNDRESPPAENGGEAR